MFASDFQRHSWTPSLTTHRQMYTRLYRVIYTAQRLIKRKIHCIKFMSKSPGGFPANLSAMFLFKKISILQPLFVQTFLSSQEPTPLSSFHTQIMGALQSPNLAFVRAIKQAIYFMSNQQRNCIGGLCSNMFMFVIRDVSCCMLFNLPTNSNVAFQHKHCILSKCTQLRLFTVEAIRFPTHTESALWLISQSKQQKERYKMSTGHQRGLSRAI